LLSMRASVRAQQHPRNRPLRTRTNSTCSPPPLLQTNRLVPHRACLPMGPAGSSDGPCAPGHARARACSAGNTVGHARG
jgi:hypothetical protein